MKKSKYQELLEKEDNNFEARILKKKMRFAKRALRILQSSIKKALLTYMKKNKVGFNEIVRRLHTTPDQVSKMQRGEANLTLSSIANLAALLEHEPTLIFKDN